MMNVVKLVLILAAGALAYQYWSTQQSASGPAVVSPNGFVRMPPMADGNAGQVVVFAPENCPSEKAQQADDLARQLASRNIPTVRAHDVTFTSSDPDPRIGVRLDSVMKGELPIVFVNGRGKANPTIEQVIAEYGATR
jgi:hypothetical protein